MKRMITVAALAMLAAPAFADVGLSINIGEPGFFGRIDLGGAPPPQVVYEKPVIIERTQSVGEPIYLRVPPEHQKNWKRYCGSYNACGQPVYFVRDDWYTNVYAPKYRENHGHGDHRDHDDHRDGDGGRGDHERDHDRERERGHD